MNGTLQEENKLVGTLSSGGTMSGKFGMVIGRDGKSAYEIAVKHGFDGTEEEWLESLKGSGGGDIDEEIIRELIDEFLEENPIDAPVTSVNGKTGAVRLTASDVGALTSATLGSAIEDALAEAKANGEFDGEDGENGVGISTVKQTTTSTTDGGTNVVTVTLTDGKTSTFQFKNGTKGGQGYSIGSVVKTSGTGAAGTYDTYAIKLNDASGTKVGQFSVYNGANGKDGTGGGGGEGSGENGATFTPAVDEYGNLSWTNDKGLPNPATVNIKGEDGMSVHYAWVDDDGHLWLRFSDHSEVDAGYVVGTDGEDGTSVTVTNVTNNTGDGQTNTVTFSDGKTLSVKNGSKGSDGVGIADAYVGDDGYLWIKYSNYDGDYNIGYVKGDKGDKPVKGTDYWTASDKAGIVSDVLSALPTWNGGSY